MEVGLKEEEEGEANGSKGEAYDKVIKDAGVERIRENNRNKRIYIKQKL